jgi:hypothetical protein
MIFKGHFLLMTLLVSMLIFMSVVGASDMFRVTGSADKKQHLYNIAVSQHDRQSGPPPHQSAFPSQPPPQMFQAVEIMPRETVIEYAGKVLQKLCEENDKLGKRQYDKPSNSVQISLRKKGGFSLKRQHQQQQQQEEQVQMYSGGDEKARAREVIDRLIEQLRTGDALELKNLTIIIALVYLDRVAVEMNVYCDSETVVELFGACLMVASKMHRNETSRESLALALNMSVQALLETESSVTESIRDLSVAPQTLANYVKPMLISGSNRLTPPPPPPTSSL